MPTVAGIPAPMLPGGPLNPFDWNSISGNEFLGVQQSALMRGRPEPLAYWQRRQIAGPPTIAMGVPIYIHSRPYSRGAGAYSPKLGVINYDPIGAGIDSPYKLPVIAGPGARYQFGAIWFDVQTTPTTMHMSPTTPIESANAMIAQSFVSAMYATTG